MSDRPTVSYCVTCHGRLWQLAQTIWANLADLREDEEIILVDYTSPDNLKRYADTGLRNPIKQRKLVYAHVDKMKHYHCSNAKNIAHQLARGLILFNLDADNYLHGFRDAIDQAQANGDRLIHLRTTAGGSFGRIGMTRDWFHRLGGYDEAMSAMGYQDTDIVERAGYMGLPRRAIFPKDRRPLSNAKQDKCEYTARPWSWEHMKIENRALSQKNIRSGNLIVNLAGWGGHDTPVSVNFHKPFNLQPVVPVLPYDGEPPVLDPWPC